MATAKRLRDRVEQLRKLFAEPPHHVAARFIRTGRRSGLLSVSGAKPLQVLRELITRGAGVRAIHAIHAAKDPERPAIVDDHRSVTYAEANREIDLLAAALRDHLGAARGRPVMVMMENRVEYVLTWFALFRLGITCAHISRYSTAEEIEPLVERSRGRVIVCSAKTSEAVMGLRRNRPDLDLRIAYVGDGEPPQGSQSYYDLVSRKTTNAGQIVTERGPSDNVVYTSGTTGRPKGAVRDFASVGVLELFAILDRLPLCGGDRHLVVAPMYHSAGQVFAILNASLGSTVFLQERFEAEDTLRRLSKFGINNVFMVPTMIHRVLDLPDEVFAKYPTPELRALISGAAPFNGELRRRAIDRFGAEVVFDFYGSTEAGWVTLVSGEEMLARPGTLGRAIPGQEIAIFGDDGEILPAGEIGTIYTRSGQIMQGYMRDKKATSKARKGEWLTVDDTGYLDERGYLYLTGRARDMVISGGINVYPVEIENTLVRHPAIREVAVVGLPDDEWGERVVAVLVADGDFDPEQARDWARTKMAPYKVPRQWELVDELPRNPTGKILKRELVERLGGA